MRADRDGPLGPIPPDLVLEGEVVRLRPLEPHDASALHAFVQLRPDVYRYTYAPTRPDADDPYLVRAFADRDAGTAVPFAIVDRASGRLVGTTRFHQIVPGERRVSLGFTLLDAAVHGGPVNVDTKLVQLTYLFETWGAWRVQIQADARNERSRKALEALGLGLEGVLRAYGRDPTGARRDAAIYAAIDDDWSRIAPILHARRASKAARLPASDVP